MNRSTPTADTSPELPVTNRWTVGGSDADRPWQMLPAREAVVLIERGDTGWLETLEMELRSAGGGGAVDRTQIELLLEASPAPMAHEAGVQPRKIDLWLPLAALFGGVGECVRSATATVAMPFVADGDRFQVRLALPYAGGLRVRLHSHADGAMEVQCRAAGRTAELPAGTRHLRAQTLDLRAGSAAAVWPAGVETELFETHGRGELLGMVAVGEFNSADLRITTYRDGDEELLQIDERSGSEVLPAAAGWQPFAAQYFAEYIKCTVAWNAPPPARWQSLTMLAFVEDRPIA